MGAIFDDVGSMLLIWLPLVLMCLMVYFLWRVVKLTPRVNTQRPASRSSSSVTWNDVAGLTEVKVELQEVVDFLRDPKRFEQLGARVPKGILFYGPPGTGKTLLAKAVAHESGASFFSQSASAFVEMFAGLGAARIRKLFAEARKHAPAIVFIDELDAVGAARTGHGFNREQDQTLNQLLVELDGFSSDDRVVVMGASNRLQDLDPALLRPGRFDRQVLVSAPDLVGREEILGVHTSASRSRRASTCSRSPGRRPGSPAPTLPTSPTRPRSPPVAAMPARSTTRTSTLRWNASWQGSSSAASSPRRRSASSPTTRPVTR